MNHAIEVNNITKFFGSQRAVSGVDFKLERGEVFGFLGPNGAGKTTTIKMLIGMTKPSEGSMSVLGINPTENAEEIHKIAGVLTEHAQMYNDLTGLENLIYYGQLFGMDKATSKERAITLLEKINLADAMDKKLSAYSTGMRQRLSLTRALMHKPKLLFLDEPTSGLDPESSKQVNALIKELASQGTTIFLCTHQLRYAQEVCTSYGLINKGIMFAQGTLDELRKQVGESYKLRVKADITPVNHEYKRIDGRTFELDVTTEKEVAQVVADIVMNGGSVFEVVTEQLSLEEIYFELTHREKTSGGGDNV